MSTTQATLLGTGILMAVLLVIWLEPSVPWRGRRIYLFGSVLSALGPIVRPLAIGLPLLIILGTGVYFFAVLFGFVGDDDPCIRWVSTPDGRECVEYQSDLQR